MCLTIIGVRPDSRDDTIEFRVKFMIGWSELELALRYSMRILLRERFLA